MPKSRLLLFTLAMLSVSIVQAQPLSGTYTINNTTATGGTNFNSLTDAITSLNTNGVAAAGATFNVSAGQTFTETPPALTASGTAGGYIRFQKGGAGVNPVVKPGTAGTVSTSAIGGNGDAVIRIAGGDYIEFNSINIDTNNAYTTNATKYEYGYHVLRNSATDGSRFVTIRNCTINLYPGLAYSAGVFTSNYNVSGTSVTPTSTAGRHESITIRANQLNRCYNGILVRGYNHSSAPYDLFDHFNTIDSNQITDMGGGSTECWGINTIYQDSIRIIANTITSLVNAAACNGIRPGAGLNSSISIKYNTISIRNSSGTMSPIYNDCGGSGTNNFIEISNNNIENCVLSGSGNIFYGIYQNVAGALVHIGNNNIRNDTCTVSGTAMYVIWCIPGTGGVNHIFGNHIYNLIHTSPTGSSTIFPIICNTGGETRLYQNHIHNITHNSSAGQIVIRSNTANYYFYNNIIHSLYTPNATNANSISAIELNTGTANQNIFYNTVYLNATSSSTGTFGTSALYISTGVNADVRNNILVNLSTPGPTGGITAAYRRSNTTLTTYADSSNNNCLFAGTPAANKLLFYDGTNAIQTLAAYKTLVGPVKDSASISELPPFINTTTAPYDLHLSSATPSNCVDRAKAVNLPTLTITTDFDGDTRTIPDIGADELLVNVPPVCVTTPTAPANAGTACPGSLTLNWPAVPGATSYDVYLNTGATATTVVSANQAGTTYTATVSAGPYAWKVIPKNTFGSATGCVTFTFTVNPAVTPSVSITAAPTGTICAGTPVTFTATPTNGGTTPTYQWKKRTASVGSNSTTYTDNTLVSGDTISVVMTSNVACASPAAVTSNLVIPNVVPRPAATVTPSGTANICAGSTVQLSANTGTGFTYQWQLNNATIPAATAANYTATAAGNYRVIISNGVCTDTSANTTVSIIAKPVATVSPATASAFCQGGSLLFSGPAPAPGITYQWQLNGININGATNDTYSATAAGNYRLVLSNGSCADTSIAVNIVVNPKPVATATPGGPTAFCTGGSVVLTANSGTGITYRWLRNNATITGATAISYTATLTGSYSVVVTNTATGCADTSAAIAVTVSAIPANTLTPSGPLTFCQGGNVRLQAAAVAGYTYVWYKDGGIIPGATQSFYVATAAGVYHVVVTNGACVTTTVTRTVVVNPLPPAVITAAGATSFCAGNSVVLNANTGAGLTYQWRLNTANIPGATSASYTATVSGIYTVEVSDGTCPATSNTITITVSTMPAPVITFTGQPSFCQGNSVTLNANTAPGYTYQWQLNGGDIPGATGASYSAAATGNYTVTITNGACVATSSPVTVGVTPAPPAVITPAGPTSFCQGGSVLLHANRATGFSYQWTFNGANIPGATSWQYTATATGNYAVVIFDGTCPATSANTGVTVNDFPVAIVTVTGGVDLSTGTFASYQWYRNGVLIPGATAQNYTATRDGYYTVVVTDAIGCSSTSPVQLITALDIDHTGNTAGVVKIWPNPATTVVNIEAWKAVDVSISTVDGKALLQSNNAKSIDIAHLPQGLYLVRITDHQSGALIRVEKLTKQ